MPATTELPEFPRPLVDRARRARAIVALTGAGISAESGVPTFRDAQTGLWAKFDPHELATPAAFARNPKLVWDWYAWRREQLGAARPNAGHRALFDIEQAVSEFLLVTQNVDGLHHAAGSRRLVELHGNIGRIKCSREGTPVSDWAPPAADEPPRCPACGAFLRPDVVWFEEALPADAMDIAIRAVRECELLLVVGTSAEVYPAAALPEYAREAGAMVVEINPEPTRLSSNADFSLRGPAGVILPALVRQVWQGSRSTA